MSSSAAERHNRHEHAFTEYDLRLNKLEAASDRARLWREGNGNPHRGAEQRITKLEEGAVMRPEVEEIIRRVVVERQRSASALIQALAPYAVLLVGVIVWLVTGSPPAVSP